MVSRNAKLQEGIGLHAGPASLFIKQANSFKSSIWVEKDDCRVNAKSLLGVLSLGVHGGMNITIIADGSDEADAVDSLCNLIAGNFKA